MQCSLNHDLLMSRVLYGHPQVLAPRKLQGRTDLGRRRDVDGIRDQISQRTGNISRMERVAGTVLEPRLVNGRGILRAIHAASVQIDP